MNTKEIGIAGKQPTLRAFPSPLLDTPNREEGVPIPSDSLVDVPPSRAVSHRPVLLPVMHIAISPRHAAQSNRYPETKDGEEDGELLSPKLEYTNRKQIVSVH